MEDIDFDKEREDQHRRVASSLLGLAVRAFQLAVALSGWSRNVAPEDREVAEAILPFLAAPLARLTCFKQTLKPAELCELMNEAIDVGRRCADAFIEEADRKFSEDSD